MERSANEVIPHLDSAFADVDADDMEAPMLALEQLQPDARGMVVLMNDSSLRSLVIESSAGIVAKGVAGMEMTLAGDDVSGFHWFRFSNGVTLYYPADVILSVRSPHS